MLKRVTNETRDVLMEYVKREPSINLFIIGDVEQFGLDVNFQEVYLQYENDTITACVLRYFANIVLYSHLDYFNVKEIADLLKTMQIERINGKKSIIDQLLPHLNHIKEVSQCYFCELNDSKNLESNMDDIKVATIADLPKIYDILSLVDFHSNNFIESNTLKLKTKAGRIYYIENNEKVLSTALTSIETSVSAMIGGVTTHFDYRNQGLASLVVSKLAQDLLNENKKPCLFYHNPKAGSIYHRLGFVNIDFWTMITLADE